MAKQYLDRAGLIHFWGKIDELKANQADLDALEALVGELPEGDAKTVVAYVDAKTENIASNDTVNGLNDKVNALIGTDNDKSVRTIANEELAKQLIAEGAQESLDTLAEIAAWIQSHPDDASAMNTAIQALQAIVAGIGGTSDEHKTVVAYVDAAIAALKIGDYAKASDLTDLAGRVNTLENAGYATTGQVADAKSEAINTAAGDATSKANKALEDAKKYTDDAVAEFVAIDNDTINGIIAGTIKE